MARKLLSTLWPEGFDPEDTRPFASAILVDQTKSGENAAQLHRHVTGQLTFSLRGLAGVQFEDGLWIVPIGCALWIPPGAAHNGLLAEKAAVINLHFSPGASALLPLKPTRLLPNPAVSALIELVATVPRRPEEKDAIAHVIHSELLRARRLPVTVAAFPSHPALRRMALECMDPASRGFTNKDWADRAAMSERSLERLVKAETGQSVRHWIVSIRLLAAVSSLIAGKTVEEVGWDAGYETPSAFIRSFRNLFGMTPGEFAPGSDS